MADIFTPPAIVAHAEDVETLVAEARTVCAAISGAEKANVQRALDAGDVLCRLREATPHGDWEKVLKRVKISSQRASEFMRMAKSPARGDLSEYPSIREAMARLEALEREAELEEQKKDPDYVPPELDTRKPGQEKWCPRCVRIGTQAKDCAACAQARIGSTASKRKEAKPATKYDEKRLWRNYNGLDLQVEAFAREHSLIKDEAYLEVREAIRAVHGKIEELRRKVGE